METVKTTQQPKHPMMNQPCSPAGTSNAALSWRPSDKRPLYLLAGIVSYRSPPGLSD